MTLSRGSREPATLDADERVADSILLMAAGGVCSVVVDRSHLPSTVRLCSLRWAGTMMADSSAVEDMFHSTSVLCLCSSH